MWKRICIIVAWLVCAGGGVHGQGAKNPGAEEAQQSRWTERGESRHKARRPRRKAGRRKGKREGVEEEGA